MSAPVTVAVAACALALGIPPLAATALLAAGASAANAADAAALAASDAELGAIAEAPGAADAERGAAGAGRGEIGAEPGAIEAEVGTMSAAVGALDHTAPCALAAEIAARNGATLVSCDAGSAPAEYRITVTSGTGPLAVTRRARAGPP